jgi:hypothetical protein
MRVGPSDAGAVFHVEQVTATENNGRSKGNYGLCP